MDFPFQQLLATARSDLKPWRPDVAEKASDEHVLEAIWLLSEDLYAQKRPDPGNSAIPAGYTYLAQFLNHDLGPETSQSPLHLRGTSTRLTPPRIALDSVYGRGPGADPHLYQLRDWRKLGVGWSSAGEYDLPKSADTSADSEGASPSFRPRRALIGDPRNDQSIMISQLHLSFLRFHNRLVKYGLSFEEARRETRWHFQWLIVSDLLPRLCSKELVRRLVSAALNASRSSLPTLPQVNVLPLEFSMGAFRCGHAMVRPEYRLNGKFKSATGAAGYPVFARPIQPEASMIGGRDLPAGWTIQWDQFFLDGASGPKSTCQMAMPFEPKLSASLRMLPIQPSDPWSSSEHRMRSLAYRTLVRSWRHQLPSGQAIAQALGETPVLSRSRGEDPLWVYVLREAEEQQSGERLGPVGARIVAEVVLGLLAGDPEWHAHSLSAWSPGIMACLRHGRPLEQRKELSLVNEIMAEQKSYGMIDFLRDARMPITQADWERRHDGLLR